VPTNYKGQVVSQDATPIPGFYAAGEVACASVHGANRLGTNSLLDLLVFGKSSGDSVIDDLRSGAIGLKELPADYAERTLSRLNRLNTQTGGASVNETRLELQRTMQKHCGVFRFKDMLVEGVAKILDVEKAVLRTEIKDKSQVWNTARVEALELDNLIEVAKATMISAEARKESRGAHVRDDAPDTAANPNGRDDVNWHKHTLWHRESNRLDYKPVIMKPLSVESIALKTRSY
jgi:succinate dehydrogenase / fumarate reductase flavoprotein subunit